jgi:hypothetical protein
MRYGARKIAMIGRDACWRICKFIEVPMAMRPIVAGLLFAAVLPLLLAGCETDGSGPVVRSTGEQRQSAIDSLTGDAPPSSIEMARGQCWMEQEKKKNVNNLDAKIAAVDACVAEKKKKYPNLPAAG